LINTNRPPSMAYLWCGTGMWPQSWCLGLEAVSRPIKASISSRTDWQTPRSQFWYWSRTVRPHVQVIFFTHMHYFLQNAL